MDINRTMTVTVDVKEMYQMLEVPMKQKCNEIPRDFRLTKIFWRAKKDDSGKTIDQVGSYRVRFEELKKE